MFENVWSFCRRHRRKILVFGGAVGGFYLLKQYLSRQVSDWEARHSQDFLEQMKRFHHFEGTIQTCDATALSLVPKVNESIQGILKVDALIEELKGAGARGSQRAQIWEELRVMVLTELASEICGEVLLVAFLRVQLSVIGGYMYLDTQRLKATEEVGLQSGLSISSSCTQEIQQKYLSQIHNYFGPGLERLVRLVQDTVLETPLGNASLNHRVSVSDLRETLNSLRSSLVSALGHNLSHFILPDQALEEHFFAASSSSSSLMLQKMLLETRDVLETKDFEQVVGTQLEECFRILWGHLSICLAHAASCSPEQLEEATAPLVKLIPVIHTHLQQRCRQHGQASSFLQILLAHEASKTYSANVYEAFSQPLDPDHNLRPSFPHLLT